MGNDTIGTNRSRVEIDVFIELLNQLIKVVE